jgi:hypothetical protein
MLAERLTIGITFLSLFAVFNLSGYIRVSRGKTVVARRLASFRTCAE